MRIQAALAFELEGPFVAAKNDPSLAPGSMVGVGATFREAGALWALGDFATSHLSCLPGRVLSLLSPIPNLSLCCLWPAAPFSFLEDEIGPD